MRDDIRDIYDSAILAVKPKNIIKNSSFVKSLSKQKIYLFGSGKAAVEMAKSIEEIFGKNIIDGLIISPYDSDELKHVKIKVGSHPIPDQKSIDAAKMMIEKFEALNEDDLFIYLLSGGSSALMELPYDLSLNELINTTEILLESGVPIDEINIIRKHLSQIKGGRLGRLSEAKGLVLVISDVIGDDLEAIGSAPLYFDSSSCEDFDRILHKYKIFDKIGEINCHESPKSPNENIEHLIVANNATALNAAKDRAQELGYSCKIVTDSLSGDVKAVAKKIVDEVLNSSQNTLLFGGESTVNVTGNGKGGRNQQLSLEVLKLIKDMPNITFLSAGTDGIDGNSDAAGGIVDSSSYREDLDDFLKNNDSYHYLKRNGDLIITGFTGTNVMDIMIAIKGF